MSGFVEVIVINFVVVISTSQGWILSNICKRDAWGRCIIFALIDVLEILFFFHDFIKSILNIAISFSKLH